MNRFRVMCTDIPDVQVIEGPAYEDKRGFFMECHQEGEFQQLGLHARFLQDNYSFSSPNVLRGLHYQVNKPQGKLVRVLQGEIFDVAVDLRRDSRTFGKHVSCRLSETNRRMLWIPPGFAHGFLVVSGPAGCYYKVTEVQYPEFERTLRWDDPFIGIPWPLKQAPILSQKDANGTAWSEAEKY